MAPQITGYKYIDEVAELLKKRLPQEHQKELIDVFQKIHSAGLGDGYSFGVTQAKKEWDLRG